jgi:hypothetical protein
VLLAISDLPTESNALDTALSRLGALGTFSSMRYWVGLTDYDWYTYLASRPDVDEVNFWQPSAGRQAVLLPVGAPFLFKLHARDGGWIIGGGTFVRYTKLSPHFAWDAFGDLNGAPTLDIVRMRIQRYRKRPIDLEADEIGPFVLVSPFFLPREQWIKPPDDPATAASPSDPETRSSPNDRGEPLHQQHRSA